MFKKFTDYFRHRTLRVNILTIFLMILLIYSLTVFWYTYRKGRAIVLEFTESLTVQFSQGIEDEIEDYLTKGEHLAYLEKSAITDLASISLSNKALLSFLYGVVKLNPDLMPHVATTQGTWISMTALQPHAFYRNEASKPLPENYAYAIQYIDRSGDHPKELWIYQNAAGKTLETEEMSHATYDPRESPWYIGVQKTLKPFISSIHQYPVTNHPGITFAFPVVDDQGKLFAVTGVDLDLQFLSLFLQKQDKLKISTNEKTLLFSQDGKIIASPGSYIFPGVNNSAKTQIEKYDPVISKAYQVYVKDQKKTFAFTNDDINYIASLKPFRSPLGDNWYLAVIVPEKDFLGSTLETQLHLYTIFLISLVIATLLISFFSKRISSPIVHLSEVLEKMRHFNLKTEISKTSYIKEIYTMQRVVASLKSALISFGHYVPKEIVQKLLDQGREIELGGQRQDLTILFSDIYNFTTISESLSTEKLMAQLTPYFKTLSDLIIQNNGTIDKYIGDAIMAFWGAPTFIPDHSFQACHAALLCQFHLQQLNDTWKKEGLSPFITRIGIHSGNVVVGNIGTTERMNYTVMGDSVNVAARLEQINKTYQTKIVLSEAVLQNIGELFLVRPLDILAVKGKKIKVKIYELVGQFQAEETICPTPSQVDLCALFAKAFALYQDNRLEEAKSLFQSIHEKYPEDYPTTLYLERLGEVMGSNRKE